MASLLHLLHTALSTGHLLSFGKSSTVKQVTDESIFCVLNSETGNQPEEIVACKFGGVIHSAFVDSGALHTMMSKENWENLRLNGLQFYCYEPSPDLNFFDGSGQLQYTVLFTASVDVVCNNISHRVSVVVIEENFTTILGRNDAKKFKVLRVGLDACTEVRVQTISMTPTAPLGKLKDFQLSIPIDSSVAPCIQPLRRVPYSLRKRIEDQITELLHLEIIEKVEGASKWVSPVVSVPKSDNTLRICVDMRRVNEAVLNEKHPIPMIEDVAPLLKDAKVFSKIDLRQAYHQIELDQQSRELTTFNTHIGHFRYRRKKKLALALLAPLIIIAVALGIYFGIKNKELHYVGGVVTNGYECAEIGSSMFSKGGSAIDAAIAALFCEGVAMPQSMGIGGGFLMTIYIRETKSVITLNAREAAPLDAHKDMFKGNATLSSRGGLSIAVPGELRGYYEAHQKYGKLPWAELIEPTIALCKKGHLITDYLEKMFKRTEWLFRMDPNLGEIFIDPKTNQPYKKGQYVKREKLAATLEVIAKKGADALYDGELTQKFVDDIQEAGGIIKVQDMNIYRPVWEPPIVAKLPNNQTLYTSPLPGCGVVLTFILNILNNFLDLSKLHSLSNWQRIVESFKFGYARRTELGDPSFVSGIHEIIDNLTSQAYGDSVRKYISDDVTYNDPKYYGAIFATARDHGTAHVSVLAPNGDAVSATSTINQYFGAGVVSKSTGIILNDEMDDFSSPNITNGFGISPSPANFIFPKKRPLSSMCPSIIVDENGDVLLVIGAAGGSKITSSIALVTIRHLWFGESLNTAISAPRLHHQLFPMRIDFENDFDKGLIKELEAIGHKEFVAAPADGFSALTGLSKRNGIIQGSGDRRRTGQVFLIK